MAFAAMLAVYYLMLRWTPLWEDDYYYRFFTTDDTVAEYGRMIGYPEAYTARFGLVSRFVIHLIVGFFLVVTDKAVFDAVTPLVFGLMFIFIARCAGSSWRDTPREGLIGGVIFSGLGAGFFGGALAMSGAPNYVYAAVLALGFYLAYCAAAHGRARLWELPLLAAFGFITGWTNEGYVIGLAAGIAVRQAITVRTRPSARQLALGIGFVAGITALCLSPFNLSRFFGPHDGPQSNLLMGSIRSLAYLQMNVISILTAVILLLLRLTGRLRGKAWRDFLRTNACMITAWVVTIIFVAATRHSSGNAHFTIDVFALIVLLAALRTLLPRVLTPLGLIATAGVAVCALCVVPVCRANYISYDRMAADLRAGANTVVVDQLAAPAWTQRFYRQIGYQLNRINLSTDSIIAAYYGSPRSVIVCREIFEASADTTVRRISPAGWGATWVALDSTSTPVGARLTLRPVDVSQLPWWIRPIAGRLPRYTLRETFTPEVLVRHLNGRRWMVVHDNPYLQERVDSIIPVY